MPKLGGSVGIPWRRSLEQENAILISSTLSVITEGNWWNTSKLEWGTWWLKRGCWSIKRCPSIAETMISHGGKIGTPGAGVWSGIKSNRHLFNTESKSGDWWAGKSSLASWNVVAAPSFRRASLSKLLARIVAGQIILCHESLRICLC